MRDLASYDEGTDTTSVVNHITYDSFGNVIAETAAVDHLFGYTGRAFDEETGLQNNLNRWYDATTGRWISEDPIGFAAGDANLYRYVGNSSTHYVDPSGLEETEYMTDAGPPPKHRGGAIIYDNRPTIDEVPRDSDWATWQIWVFGIRMRDLCTHYATDGDTLAVDKRHKDQIERWLKAKAESEKEDVRMVGGPHPLADAVGGGKGALKNGTRLCGWVKGLFLRGKSTADDVAEGVARRAAGNAGRLTPGVGGKFHDAASQVSLRGTSLNSGTTALQKAGLVRRPGRGGAYEFVDPNTGAVRAKWVPKIGKEPAHWSKFEPSGNQSHYLNNAGRAVTGTDRAHRIPSNSGGPIGGGGPGSPTPMR